MVRSLKTLGLEEIQAFKRRVLRQSSLGRIGNRDRDDLIDLVNKIEARVTVMQEKSTDGEEYGFGA